MPEPHIKLARLAILWDCGVKFLKKLIAEGHLVATMMGKDTAVTVASAIQYQQNHRIKSRQEMLGVGKS